MAESNGVNEFLRVSNQLEYEVKRRAQVTKESSYLHALRAGPVEGLRIIRNNMVFLENCVEMRNILVHWNRSKYSVPFIPNPDTIQHLEHIVDVLTKPIVAYSLGATKPQIHNLNEPLSQVLPMMRESDFSQVVVKADDGAHRLVTREGIARWVEANIEEELVHLGDVTLADIFAHENQESYTYAARSDALPEIMELFANSVAKLRAVLITENGKSHETPLKIVTPWDLHDHVM